MAKYLQEFFLVVRFKADNFGNFGFSNQRCRCMNLDGLETVMTFACSCKLSFRASKDGEFYLKWSVELQT